MHKSIKTILFGAAAGAAVGLVTYATRRVWKKRKEWWADDSQDLLRMGNAIAATQLQKRSRVHRGVSCDGCKQSPLRGTRYKCVNCDDYDICESCESKHIHNRTHVFMKIEIPMPPWSFVDFKHIPCFYPGGGKYVQEIPQEDLSALSNVTGFSLAELVALHEEFWAISKTPKGISREVYMNCLGPFGSERGLLADRIFRVFDADHDGVIDFHEFCKGISLLSTGTFDEKTKAAFDGYDVDQDNYISKQELRSMFRAHFQTSTALLKVMVQGFEQDILRTFQEESSNPVSASFSSPILAGDMSEPVLRRRREAPFSKTVDESLCSPTALIGLVSEKAIEDSVERTMKAADLDGDGKLSFDEFLQFSRKDPRLLECIDAFGSVF